MVHAQYCSEWTDLVMVWHACSIPLFQHDLWRKVQLFVCGYWKNLAQGDKDQSCASLLSSSSIYYWLSSTDNKSDTRGSGLRVRAFFHKTVRVCHVYCNFKIGFTCRITVIFGTLKNGSLLINTLASNICFSYRNIFQNGVDALPKIVDAFLSKSSNFHLVRIIR